MRKNRLIWSILWIVSLVGISFFGGAVSYGFFMMLTLVPIISLLYLVCVYFCFHIYQELQAHRLVADEPTPFFFTLKNEFFFGFAGLRVKFFSSFSKISGLDDDTMYELLPKTGITLQTTLVCKYRGEYEVGVKTVEMQDYFRLFTISFHNPETLRVIVRPKLVHLEGLNCIDYNRNTLRDSYYKNTEPDILVRNYISGDDIRQIHWRASAVSGQLMIRKRTGEEQQGVVMLMSTRRGGTNEVYLPIENKILEIVLALSLFLCKENIPVRLHSYQGQVSSESIDKLDEFEEFYEKVAKVEFREEYTDDYLMTDAGVCSNLLKSELAVLVVHEWSDAVYSLLAMLDENNVYSLICYVTNEEKKEFSLQSFTRGKLISIHPEDELKEVL